MTNSVQFNFPWLCIRLHKEALFKRLCSPGCMCACVRARIGVRVMANDRDTSSRWDNYGKQSLWSQGKRINTKCTLWRLRAEKLCNLLITKIRQREWEREIERECVIVETLWWRSIIFTMYSALIQARPLSSCYCCLCVLRVLNLSGASTCRNPRSNIAEHVSQLFM